MTSDDVEVEVIVWGVGSGESTDSEELEMYDWNWMVESEETSDSVLMTSGSTN